MQRLILVILAAMAVSSPAESQGNGKKARYYEPSTVPSPVRQIVTALGERVQRAGKERVILTGTLNRRGTVSSVRITRELPGYLRIDETGGKNKPLVFDLTDLKSDLAIDDDDEDLAEMVDGDTAETFLSQLAPGSTVRKLGDRFNVKGESGFGSYVDIYEVASPVSLKRDKQSVIKHFMFDSNTGLLRRIAYRARVQGRQVLVQTVLADYSQVDGQALPGRITRIVDGATALSFTRGSAVVAAAMADNTFTVTKR